MVSFTFWLAGLAVDGPASLKLIGCGGVPVNAVGLIIRQDVKLACLSAPKGVHEQVVWRGIWPQIPRISLTETGPMPAGLQ